MAEPSTSLHPDPFVPQDSESHSPRPRKGQLCLSIPVLVTHRVLDAVPQLSGQLRLRLQYAKLKVEHGWQRQNLNEVENLYFRHTQMHRPLPAVGHRNIRALWENVASTSSASSPFEEYTTDHTESSLPKASDAPTALPPGSISPPTKGDATMTDAFTPVPDAHRAASTPRGGRRGTARKRLPSSRPTSSPPQT
ncbi:hypothetical protein B0H21DRAFT_824393 [Amylocystis lapponica]|nr:hypothetical protein B0H21DRAFT_824393 [Amylocystis lapponica]